MNDEIKPLYIPESSGNSMPNLSKHPAHNETPVPLHRTRTEPSRAMSDEPMKHLLPSGTELRDIIRRRIKSRPMAAPALWAALCQSYQTRPRQEQSVIDAVAGMLAERELEQRDGKLHSAEPTDPPDIDPALWTKTHTARVMHVLTAEPQSREALARQTGLNPKQVSKAMYLLIQEGKAEVVGDNPRTWRRVAKKMDADDVRKAVLERLGDKISRPEIIVNDIEDMTDWSRDDASDLLEGMLASGYLTLYHSGIGRPKTQPETTLLTENQTRAVVLDRVSGVCDTDVVVADVMRLSGWAEADVRRLIDDLGTEGELIDMEGTLHKPLVKSEAPPAYEIGDDDDGEIGEPGISRPDVKYAPESAVLTFVERDGERIIAEHSITIDEDGLCFDGAVLTFAGIDAAMPVLRRVHRALFSDGD